MKITLIGLDVDVISISPAAFISKRHYKNI
jgi:hypothetical protein